jgi:hypothetical protein
VESSCERGNAPLGSVKCWELPIGCTTDGLWSGTELERSSIICAGRALLNKNFSDTHLFEDE